MNLEDCPVCASVHRDGHWIGPKEQLAACGFCGVMFRRNDVGRPALYCSDVHRRAAFRRRAREAKATP